MFNAKPSTSKDYVHIYSEDPALDRDSEAFDHDAWVSTGDSLHLPTKEGQEPIEFTLRHLNTREKMYCHDIGARLGNASLMYWLVALALKEISPYEVDGNPAKIKRAHDPQTKFFTVSDEDMAQIETAAGGSLLGELGARVAKESFGDPT